MTLDTTLPRTTKTTKTTEAEQLLRDTAFVLRLTRRVKDDILRDLTRPNRPVPQTTDHTPAALGV